jgi:enamine deaminase RidA (YjgF/YER057c/UK114 family)
LVVEVHGAFFRAVHPATTVVQVSAFIDADWLIEVEADAIASDDEI